MVTPNYDYSIASAYRPTLGQWVTLRLCRTGTGTLNSRTSFSFATTDGWTGTTTNAAVTDKLTRYWYFGGLWNYACNADAVMYIRNMSVICMDSDTSNCTFTGDGIALEKTTTNLWVGGFTIYNNYGVTASLTKLNETYMGEPVYRLAMTPTVDNVSGFRTELWSHGVYGSSITYLANTKYANSIFWRCVNKPDISVGNTASNIGGWTDGPTVKYSDGWNRTMAFRDGTVTTDKTGHIFFSFRSLSAQAGETIYVDWACPQIEQQPYQTAYTKTSRSGYGMVEIPYLSLPTFSLAFKFMPTWEMYKYQSTSYNAIMLRMFDADPTRYIDYRDWYSSPSISQTYAASFFDLEPDTQWDNVAHHWHHNVSYVANKWHDYFIIKSGSTMRIVVKLDGVTLRDQTFTYTDSTKLNDFVLSKLQLGYSDSLIWSGEYKDLSIYNKVLSDIEIDKLSKPSRASPRGAPARPPAGRRRRRGGRACC
jgi:hypothetical protein